MQLFVDPLAPVERHLLQPSQRPELALFPDDRLDTARAKRTNELIFKVADADEEAGRGHRNPVGTLNHANAHEHATDEAHLGEIAQPSQANA
jgi:hypothetical protein